MGSTRILAMASAWWLGQLICMGVLVAQQVPSDPTSTHIFPAGAQRGTKLDVYVGGECLPPSTHFRLFGAGVHAGEELGPKVSDRGEPSPRRRPGEVHIYYPKEWRHSIEVDSQAPLGACYWRVACARGATGARPFIIGDLPEHIEQESNSTLPQSEAITLPVTINGQIAGERDLDYYQFRAEAGQVVSVDVVARRIGSPLEPQIEFFDESGRRLPAQSMQRGSDPQVALRIPSTGRYRLMIGHLGFQGGPQYVYRATLRTEPLAAFIYPSGGQAGKRLPLQIATLSGAAGWEWIEREVSLPDKAVGEPWLDREVDADLPFPVHIHAAASALDNRTNDSQASAQLIESSMVVHGQLETAQDEDWYCFAAPHDGLWQVQCERAPPGSNCLPVISVIDQDGKALFEGSAADEPREPIRAQVACRASQKCFVRVRDLQQGSRGGPDFIYRLSIDEARDGFALNCPVDVVNVLPGGRAEVELRVRRTGRFAEAIDLAIDALPEGVRIEPAQIAAGQSQVKLAFIAEESARPHDRAVRIIGRAQHQGTQLESVAEHLHLGRDSEHVAVGSPTLPHLQLNVRDKPVVRLYCSEAYQYAYRGSVYLYAMEIERLNGFDGPVHIEIADRQIKDLDGIVVHELELPPNQTQFNLPIYLPETMHINVQAHSNVYAQAYAVYQDKFGQRQSQCFVSEMRCMIRPLPTVVKLVAAPTLLSAPAGQPIECELKLERTSNFAGPMRIEMLEPKLPSGVLAPIAIEAGQSSVRVVVPPLPTNVQRIVWQATGQLPGYHSLVTQAMQRLP